MAASGASLNWDKSKAVMLGEWKNKQSPFPCPVLAQDGETLVSWHLPQRNKAPGKPVERKAAKEQSTAQTLGEDGPHSPLFARANVAAMMIASCARCHVSCAVATEEAIKSLHTMLRGFVWSGKLDKLGLRLVSADAASVPHHFGGLGLPNILAIQHAHHLRFWAQPMGSNEDWVWALRAAGLSRPLQSLNNLQRNHLCSSLAACERHGAGHSCLRHFTLSLILDSPHSNLARVMIHPDWSESTWALLRKMPVPKVASLFWKIGTSRFPHLVCNKCGCAAKSGHIIFSCPVSASLWRLDQTMLQAHLWWR